MTKPILLTLSLWLAVTSSLPAWAADTLEQYSKKCDQAIGVTVPDFVCDAGTLVPDTHPTGNRCDRPNQLNMVCDPGSRFQVLTDNANAAVVAHCRKKGNAAGNFGDIAVIQYSKQNGATCFYQALGTLSGNVKAPSKGTGAWPWMTPTDTAGIRCARCHDNGALIRSPYLTQLKDNPGEKNVLPGSHDSSFNSKQPYAFVGTDFSSWRAYEVKVKGNLCNDCHRMGVSNLTALDPDNGEGTSLDFGIRATSAFDHNKNHSKNKDSAESPLWMTPGTITFNQGHLDAAEEIQKCALRRDEHPLPNSDLCRLTLYASAFTGGSDRYAAIWAKVGPKEWVARHGMTSDQYQQEFDKFVGQGFRLVVVDGYEVDGAARFAAIWNKVSSPPWAARHGLTGSAYQAEFNKLVGQGYRLVWVNGYTVKGQDRYAAIWEKSPGPPFVARHGMTSAEYQAEFNKQVGLGFRLVVVSGYAVGSEARYAAIWQKDLGPPFVARHGMTSAEYQQAFDKNVGDGFRLALVNGYRVGQQTLYAAIWDKSASPAWVAKHGMTSSEYQDEFNTLTGQGYRLIDVSGY
jgi:hypothetical protein